jgi:hypothetical protein
VSERERESARALKLNEIRAERVSERETKLNLLN